MPLFWGPFARCCRAVHESAVFQVGPSEVQQQSNFQLTQSQVVDELGVVDSCEVCFNLEFDEDVSKTDEVCTVRGRNYVALVLDGKEHFRAVFNAQTYEFELHSSGVHPLEVARSELSVNLHHGANYGVGARVALGRVVHGAR